MTDTFAKASVLRFEDLLVEFVFAFGDDYGNDGVAGDFKAVPIDPVAVPGERGCMLIGLTGVSDPGYSEGSRYD